MVRLWFIPLKEEKLSIRYRKVATMFPNTQTSHNITVRNILKDLTISKCVVPLTLPIVEFQGFSMEGW